MLNDAKIKAAKPRDKDYRLSDSGQLYLQVSRAGGKHWRMNYTYGKNAKGSPAQKTLAFGSYGGRHVPHGCRAAFSTYMNERAKLLGNVDDRAIIDLMLAHVPPNRVEGSYNRAAYMERRRELAQEWADILLDGFWPPEIHLGQPIRYAATGPGRVTI